MQQQGVSWGRWRKSSYSNPNGSCVETASGGGTVYVRDDRQDNSPVLAFGAGAWRDLTTRLRAAG